MRQQTRFVSQSEVCLENDLLQMKFLDKKLPASLSIRYFAVLTSALVANRLSTRTVTVGAALFTLVKNRVKITTMTRLALAISAAPLQKIIYLTKYTF